MKLTITLTICLLCCKAFAQDLTGTWEGAAMMGADYVKMVIIRCGNEYVGYTYDEALGGYCKVHFSGTFDVSAQRLRGKGQGFIAKSLGHSQSSYSLTYTDNGGMGVMKGTIGAKTTTVQILSLGMQVPLTLYRKSYAVDTTDYMRRACGITKIEVPKKIEPVKEEKPVAVPTEDEKIIIASHTRKTDTVKTITTKEKRIFIKLFDSGVEDGDSVSIIHNNKIISSKQRVSGKPYEFEINLDDVNALHEITLVAHNLGSIPPNTATVIIEAGSNKYTLNVSADLNRNAMIVVKYAEPKN